MDGDAAAPKLFAGFPHLLMDEVLGNQKQSGISYCVETCKYQYAHFTQSKVTNHGCE
jgi:hypothetical protein